ncbi:MAG: hypothetical protein LBS12_04495 [Prevotellaceae bacterium]|jgi:hypothetical protein|nr:hypothetical protein [Prevotellaceae bacterium]
METEEGNKRLSRPFIIANPIYDTAFKRLMENRRIASFFLGMILELPIADLSVLPREFTYYKLDIARSSDRKEKEREDNREKRERKYSIARKTCRIGTSSSE